MPGGSYDKLTRPQRLAKAVEEGNIDDIDYQRMLGFLRELYTGSEAFAYRPLDLAPELMELTPLKAEIEAALLQVPALKEHGYFNTAIANYAYGGLYFEMFNASSINKNEFLLYPGNLHVLDYVLKSTPKPQTIVDFGCGMGNMFPYLKKISPATNYYGVDNFEELPRDAVQAFQALTSNVPIETHYSGAQPIDLVFGIAFFALRGALPDMLKLNAKRYIFESLRVSPLALSKYMNIIYWNEFIVVAEPKN